MERDPSVERRSLAGKVAIVTGASRGIGLAVAESLVHRGAHVVMLARHAGRLEKAAAKFGASAAAVPTDVSDPASVRRAFEQIVDQFGRLDILINNAGLAGLSRIENLTDDAIREQVDINLMGVIYCSREAIAHLRKQGGGDIVTVSSTSVGNPYPYLSMYAATKAAVEQFSSALRREVKADGIRVVVVRLGPSWTSFAEGWDADVLAKAYQEWSDGGYAGWDGAMDPSIAAEAVVHALGYPAQAGMDFFEINPTARAPILPPDEPPER